MSTGNDREFIDYLQSKEGKMKDRGKMLYLGAMACFMAGVILAITAAECSHPLVIGLTGGACACFVATAILLTIRRRWVGK
ncbi:hypothetical protein ES703_81223 [subsurface metagenome]